MANRFASKGQSILKQAAPLLSATRNVSNNAVTSSILKAPVLRNNGAATTHRCLHRFSHTESRLHEQSYDQVAPSLDMLNEKESFVQKRVAAFAEKYIQPFVKEMDENCEMRPEIIQGLFENGLMGVEIEQKYGGPEASFFELILILEELAKVDISVSSMVDVQNTITEALLIRHGDDEQKRTYLPQLANNMVAAFCMSERESGSDAFALHTQAVKQGDSYVINGSKMWATNAKHADLFYVMANANPAQGYKGITCFLVPRDLPGVSIGRCKEKLGMRASSTCPVFFNHVEVPESSVLGGVGEGYKHAINVINAGRIGTSAQMVGLAQGCLDKAMFYIKNRVQNGNVIWNSQAIQHQVAQVASQITATRLMVYNAARRKMNNQPYTKEAAMAKYLASEVAQLTTSRCMEWCGVAAISKNNCIEKYYRDCKIGAIYEGTSNIQLNTIAKYIELNR